MNLPEYLILALALAKLGGVIVPLNYRLHEEELAYLIDHSKITGIASEPAFADLAEALAAPRSRITCRLALEPMGGEWTDLRGEIDARRGARVENIERTPSDIARILYTSGTTTRPKGVMITHGNVLANMQAHVIDLELGASTVTLNASPLYHVAGLDIPGFTIWYVGGTMVLRRRFDPESFLAAVERHQVTGTCIGATVTHMIRTLETRGDYDLSSVRWLIFGQVAPALQEDLRKLFHNAVMVESYGLTEACNGVAARDAAHEHLKPGSVGRPHHWVDVKVVNEQGASVAPGALGEITVRGAKVSPGYLDDPEATVQAFRDGWFHTGDLGYVDEDGYLYVKDRLKDMIRSGSENMASTEIEAVVYEFDGVGEAAVIGVPHPKWVEVPVVFVSAAHGATVDPAALIDHCRAHLGRFKVPKAVYEMDELPRLPTGKVLKRQLRELADSQVPVWTAESDSGAVR